MCSVVSGGGSGLSGSKLGPNQVSVSLGAHAAWRARAHVHRVSVRASRSGQTCQEMRTRLLAASSKQVLGAHSVEERVCVRACVLAVTF